MTVFSVDIDGTVAHFNKAIADLAKSLGVTTDPKPLDDWIVDHQTDFWSGLDDMSSVEDKEALRAAVNDGHTLHYISRRPSTITALTIEWLQRYDYPSPTSVHLTNDKGHMTSFLRSELHVDDLVPHAAQIVASSQTKVYLIRRPWNQHVVIADEDESRSSSYNFDLPMVGSVEEFITFVRA